MNKWIDNNNDHEYNAYDKDVIDDDDNGHNDNINDDDNNYISITRKRVRMIITVHIETPICNRQ